MGQTKGKEKAVNPIQKKRNALNPLEELDQNTLEVKQRRVETQGSDDVENETKRVGGVADAARQHCQAS